MPKEKRIGGFEVFDYADISTGYASSKDCALVERVGEALPGVLAQYQTGWFIYVPLEPEIFEEHQEALAKAGFSRRYITIVTALFLHRIPYARFDADGGHHDVLPLHEDHGEA